MDFENLLKIATTIILTQWRSEKQRNLDRRKNLGASGTLTHDVVQFSCIKSRSSCLNLSNNTTREQVNDFLEEITLMKAVGLHKNILNLIGCCIESSPNIPVVECASEGDLLSYLKN